MTDLVPAEGPILAEIRASTYDIWSDGLDRPGYGRYDAAQLATPGAGQRLRRTALVDGSTVLASAKEYRFDAALDGRAIRVLGIGAVFTQPAHRGRGHARTMLERILERASAGGVDAALLFSEINPDYYARLGFSPLDTTDVELRVIEDARRGAPATLVHAGEDRDLADIAATHPARAAPFRFHLERDRDLVHYTIAKKRLLAGLSPIGAREVRFFVAEEGASAVAYVVIAVSASAWTLEEAGDRDPSGARVGAILQALIARDPAEQPPPITPSLPPHPPPPPLPNLAHTPPPP